MKYKIGNIVEVEELCYTIQGVDIQLLGLPYYLIEAKDSSWTWIPEYKINKVIDSKFIDLGYSFSDLVKVCGYSGFALPTIMTLKYITVNFCKGSFSVPINKVTKIKILSLILKQLKNEI